jgi:uncharacterized protein (DUF1330 family)
VSEPFRLVALLTVADGQEADFERYETQAVAIMARHGGRLERRMRCHPRDESAPDEVHVVSFPDQAAFQRYRADPELTALADLRARVVRRTVVWPARDLPPFPV